MSDLAAVRADREGRLRAEVAIFAAVIFAVEAIFFALIGQLLLGLLVAAFAAVAITWGLVQQADTLVESMAGDVTAPDEGSEPRLRTIVEGLSLASGVRSPRVLMLDTPAANAFTFGSDRSNSTLVVTTGLVDSLNRVELEGVLAHALAHIESGQTRLSTVSAVTLGLPATLADRAFAEGGPPRVLGWPLLLIARALRPLQGALVEPGHDMAADLEGISWTRYPPGLARALETLDGADTVIPSATIGLAPLFVLPPFAPDDASPVAPLRERAVEHRPLVDRAALLREL